MNDERLRAARRARVAGPSGPSCPPPSTLVDAASGSLSPEQVRAAVDHVAECPSCAEDWSLVIAARPVRRSAWVPIALAVGGAAAVAAATTLWVRAPSPVVMRDGVVTAVAPMDGEVLPRGEFTLRWVPGPAGANYVVRVADLTGAVLFQSAPLAAPEVRVPEDALKSVPVDDSVVWSVEVHRTDGTSEVRPVVRVVVR